MTIGRDARRPVFFHQLALLWILIPLFIVVMPTYIRNPISNDAIQAIVGAKYIRGGVGYYTSIIYFDENYRFGAIPAPQTVWPPGYPAVISMVSLTGLPEESSAILISRVSYIILFPMTYLLAFGISKSRVSAHLSCLWLAGISALRISAVTANSEMLFTVLLVGTFLLIAGVPDRPKRWLFAGLLSGIGCTVRYAGIFLIASVSLFAIIEALRDRMPMRAKIRQVAWLLPGWFIFLLILLRNYLQVGNLRGGNSKIVSNPIWSIGKMTVVSLFDLLYGVTKTDLISPEVFPMAWSVAAGGFAMATGYIAYLLAVHAKESFRDSYDGRGMLLHITLFSLIYIVGIMWLGKTTMINFGERFFVPLTPFLVVGATSLLIQGRGKKDCTRSLELFGNKRPIVVRAMWTITLIVTVVISQQVSFPRKCAAHERNIIGTEIESIEWLQKNTSDDEVVMVIGNGQRIGYDAKRFTAAVPPVDYTSEEWGEAKIQSIVEKYGINTVVVDKAFMDAGYTRFAENLMQGIKPVWMNLLFSTNGTFVYGVDRSQGRQSQRHRPPEYLFQKTKSFIKFDILLVPNTRTSAQ